MNEITATIGLPCGVHSEVKTIHQDGSVTHKVTRNNTGHCESIWCLLNSGEWKDSYKYRTIIQRMKELGWDFNKGIPAVTYYLQALQEFNQQAQDEHRGVPD